jgi:hypothetical protein
MKLREASAVSRAARGTGALCCLWTCARFVNSFFYHGAEYRSLHREARILLTGPCVTDAAAISGALIDCQAARRIVNGRTFGFLYATQHATRDVVVDTVRGATHELGFLVQLCLLLVAVLFGAHMLVRRMAVGRDGDMSRRWGWSGKSFGAHGGYSAGCGRGVTGAFPVYYSAGARIAYDGGQRSLPAHALPSDDEADDDDDDDYDSDTGRPLIRGFGGSRKIIAKLD